MAKATEGSKSVVVNRTAEIERQKAEAAQAKARADAIAKAEAERKRQAQADLNKKPTSTKEAEQRNALASASTKQTQTNAKIDTKKSTTTAAKTTTTAKANTSTAKKDTNTKKDTGSKTGSGKTVPDAIAGFEESIQDILDLTSDAYGYTPIETIQAVYPTLRSAQELAALYGLDYNLDNIYNTLMKSVDEGYKVRYADQDIAEDKYYDNTATAQGTLMSTLDNQKSQAIMSGVNKGMQAAQALSTMLGISQQFAGGASQLAADRGKLSKEYSASKAQTGVNALTQYNTMGQQLADISKSIYSSDATSYAAQLGYNADANTANATMEAAQSNAQSNLASNLSAGLAQIWNGYQNGQYSLAEAQINADAMIKAYKSSGADAAAINANASSAANTASIAANNTANQQNTANKLIENVASGVYSADDGIRMLEGYFTNGGVSSDIYNSTKSYLDKLRKPAVTVPTTPTTTPSTSGTTTPSVPGVGFNWTGNLNPQ